MKTCKFLLLIFFVIILGCSDDLTDSVTDEVDARVFDNTLIITNNYYKPIYYFASEQGSLALINWAPISSETNKINAFNNEYLDINKIFNYEKGRQIVVIYWSDLYPEDDRMHSIIIDT
jgi:hypothetical protein